MDLQGDTPVTLTSKQHRSKLLDCLYTLQQSHKACDINIKCDSLIIPVHRLVLAATLEKFQAEKSWKTKRVWNIDHLNLNQDELSKIVRFLYTGCLMIQNSKVQDYLNYFKALELSEGIALCKDLISDMTSQSETSKQETIQTKRIKDHSTKNSTIVKSKNKKPKTSVSKGIECDGSIIKAKGVDTPKRKRGRPQIYETSTCKDPIKNIETSSDKNIDEPYGTSVKHYHTRKATQREKETQVGSTKDAVNASRKRRHAEIATSEGGQLQEKTSQVVENPVPNVKSSNETPFINDSESSKKSKTSIPQDIEAQHQKSKTSTIGDNSSPNISSTKLGVNCEEESEKNNPSPTKFQHRKCRKCSQTFDTHSQLVQHRKEHLVGNWNSRYKCNLCSFKDRRKLGLDRHKFHKHGVPFDKEKYVILKCEVENCKYQTIDIHVFKSHQTSHKKEEPFKCKVCEKTFKRKGALDVHQRLHIDSRPFKCPDCDKSFTQASNLQSHVAASHQKGKKFMCDQCPYGSLGRKEFAFHMFNHHKVPLPNNYVDKILTCDQCSYTCFRPVAMKQHKITHTGEKLFMCTYCGQRLANRTSLRVHIRYSHTGERPEKCEHCGMGFVDTGKLKQHVRVKHTEVGVKNFQCPHCDYRCAMKGNLGKHIKSLHSHQDNKSPHCNQGNKHNKSIDGNKGNEHNKLDESRAIKKTITNQDLKDKEYLDTDRKMSVEYMEPEKLPSVSMFCSSGEASYLGSDTGLGISSHTVSATGSLNVEPSPVQVSPLFSVLQPHPIQQPYPILMHSTTQLISPPAMYMTDTYQRDNNQGSQDTMTGPLGNMMSNQSAFSSSDQREVMSPQSIHSQESISTITTQSPGAFKNPSGQNMTSPLDDQGQKSLCVSSGSNLVLSSTPSIQHNASPGGHTEVHSTEGGSDPSPIDPYGAHGYNVATAVNVLMHGFRY
ncbi:unnamed protein product [Owenia fusiformis]|uniref:Uncharacterized protein n=1 Tax=Owenia fusiformis TaxID=6347 RepID=A0A8J1UG20_OWEFU|nr:unnamed protein product [Owenia fusiformis]